MKEIWLINYHAYPPGTSKWTRHFDLFKNLSREYSFTCFGADYIHDTGENLLNKDEKIKEEIFEGIKYITIKSKGYRNIFSRYLCYIFYFFRILKLSKKIKEKPNVIIGSSPDLLMGLCAYILSKKYNCKFIFEIRDVWPETLVELDVISKLHPMYFIFRKMELFLYKKANGIIALAPGVVNYLTELKIKEEKIFYINNGVDIEKFNKNLELYKKVEILPKDKFNITYTGAISINNGLDILIEAAKILEKENYKNVFINIFGRGTEEESLKNVSSNLSNIKFHGSIKKEIVPTILNKSDILFFSFKETNLGKKFGISPNKLFEYLASKTPILFSCKSFNDPIKEGNCGISLKELTPQKVVEAILEFNKMSDNSRKNLGINGYEYVCQNFEMKILSNKLKNCIEFCLKNN